MAQPEEVFFGWMRGRRFKLTENYSELDERFTGLDKGVLVKAVMVSVMGDVGVTRNLEAASGYELRVQPHELEPIEPVPKNICAICFCILSGHDHAKCSRDRKCEKCKGPVAPCFPECRRCGLEEWRANRSDA